MIETTRYWLHKGMRGVPMALMSNIELISYLSDLQARLARLERSTGEASTAPEVQRSQRNSEDREFDREEMLDEQIQPVNRSSPSGTRENSPRSRQNLEDADLMNPMVESSKFLSSSTGRTCKHYGRCQSIGLMAVSSLPRNLFELVFSRSNTESRASAHSQIAFAKCRLAL
jgi:hypothetical protein